ncbi:MAG: hypothetical protein AAF725_22385, partial [Acidobacteriota bacterium]
MRPPKPGELIELAAEPWPGAPAPRAGAAASGDGPDLPEGYYLDNFRAVLTTVLSRYDDLLSAGERAYVDDFLALPQGAQRLYVRLIMRKGPCFRLDRLRYPEIDDLGAAVAALTAAGLLDHARDEPPESLWGLLLRS